MTEKTATQRHRHGVTARRQAPRWPVVAEVLEDGTIRPVGTARVRGSGDRYSVGTVNGDGWVLWWERRRLNRS